MRLFLRPNAPVSVHCTSCTWQSNFLEKRTEVKESLGQCVLVQNLSYISVLKVYGLVQCNKLITIRATTFGTHICNVPVSRCIRMLFLFLKQSEFNQHTSKRGHCAPANVRNTRCSILKHSWVYHNMSLVIKFHCNWTLSREQSSLFSIASHSTYCRNDDNDSAILVFAMPLHGLGI